MLPVFRRISSSVVGTALMVLVLVMILIGFAMQDVRSVFSGGGFGTLGAGTLAKIGDEEIRDRDVDSAMRRVLQRAQQQNPEVTYASIANQFDPVLEQLITERTLLAFTAEHGLTISKRLVDAQIANLPQTRGLDGKFSEQSYAAFLQQQQLTDGELRRVLQSALAERMVLAPAAVDPRVPIGVALPYASMLLEGRDGHLGLVPTDAFRAGLNPSDGDLQSFYGQNRQRYIVPEQRVVRMAKITPESVPAPTEDEIAAYYKANQATYAGSESRVISQVVTQDKRQADGVAARAKAGGTFAAAAAPAGFAPADVDLGSQTRAQFAGLANEAVANAAFSAAKGAVIGPVRSDLGWHVLKVEDVRGASGRSLAQAHDEIAGLVKAAKSKEALTDMVAQVEDKVADGASFNEAVAAAKLPVITTPPVNSAGSSRTDKTYSLPAELQPALKAGFAMSPDDDPEVVTLPDNAGYALVAVDRVIEAAPAPLAEIKDRVRADWIQRKASDRARAVATDVAAKVARGMPLDQAMQQAGTPLPPVQPMSARRIQISRASAEAAAPLRMLFSLAQGKSRMVADPKGRGFFIIKTEKITPGNASNNPMLIAQMQAEFQQTATNELGEQMLAAMKSEMGIKRNEEAIATSKRRITGTDQ